jgi:hypothetical protein
MISSADSLVGLGAGLTPSGDDFLGGMFFAHRVLRSVFPDLDFIDWQPLVGSYASRTNQISHTLLRDLSLGHAVAPLHGIINCLLSEAPTDEMYSLIIGLERLGHSTGWDLLTGLLAGLLSIHMPRHVSSSSLLTQAVQG